jgi:hypothetical protein
VNCSGCNCASSSDAVATAVDESLVTALSEPMKALAPNVLAAQPVQSPAMVAALFELGPFGWAALAGLAAWYLLKGRK